MMSSNEPDPSPAKRVLILALSGIGNLLMQSPVFKAIKQSHPDWHITVWVAPRGTKVLAENNPYIDAIFEAPIKNSVLAHFRLIWQLAKGQFDIGLMLSPGQLIKGAIYMYLAGIPQRLAHRYPLYGNPASQFLLTDAVSEEPNIHDIEQNLRLLPLLNIPVPSASPTYDFTVPVNAQQTADRLLHEWGVPRDRALIGIHPGSAPGFEFKRWPAEYFAGVAKELIAKQNAHILIFGGPDEMELKQHLKMLIARSSPVATVITTDLLTTAAIMQHCALFLTNDSGLMHLAAASGVKVYAFFGPTNEAETGPRGPGSTVIRAPGTTPTYITEAATANITADMLTAIKPDTVLRALEQF